MGDTSDKCGQKEYILPFYVDIHKIKDNNGPTPATIKIDDPYLRKLYGRSLTERTMDRDTLNQIQILDLHRAVDNTATSIGSLTLLKSLIQADYSLDAIKERQESVREIESDDRLRQALDDYTHELKKSEVKLFNFFNGHYALVNLYFKVNDSRRAGKKIYTAARSIPQPESAYISRLMKQIDGFEHVPAGELFKGPIYQTFRGIRSKSEVKFYTPRSRWGPRSITMLTCAPIWMMAAQRIGVNIDPSMFMGIAMGSGMYALYMKKQIDEPLFAEPWGKRLANDAYFNDTLDAIGGIDELLSMAKYAQKHSGHSCMPEMTDEPVHNFTAKNIKNPILGNAKSISSFIPNDVNLNGSRVTIITGPNSGGKTTYCKSIVQNQILAQIGGYILATDAKINIADRIAYQYYMPDRLQSSEGDFGVNMQRTKEIFLSTTPKSMVVMNTLASGTTFEEELFHSKYVIKGFHQINNNTLLVTHNHRLAQELKDENIGQYLMVELDGDRPTYRFVPGISKISRADVVARNMNFSEEDVKKYLSEKGY